MDSFVPALVVLCVIAGAFCIFVRGVVSPPSRTGQVQTLVLPRFGGTLCLAVLVAGLLGVTILSLPRLLTPSSHAPMSIASATYPDIAAANPFPKTGVSVKSDIKKLAKASSAQRMTATSAIVRLAQLDPSYYDNQSQASAYMYSACSTTSMTEVINAWAKIRHTQQYTIGQVLDTEIAVNAIGSDVGLKDDHGIDRTLAKYGLKITWLQSPTEDDLISVSSKTPVIIDFPPGNWSGGHLLVARGGDASSVYLVDSSSYNMPSLPRGTAYGQFSYYWNGFAAVASPM
jgi:Peptidase_C39 like family